MKIKDLLNENSIKLNMRSGTKEEIIEKLVDIMDKNANILDKEEYKRKVLDREKEGTTGVGEGIAIPHGKSKVVTKPRLVAATIKEGTEFESLDGKPVNLIFLIAAPDTKDNIHLEVLSRLSTLLMDEEFRKKLLNARNPKEFLKIIDEEETKKIKDESNAQNKYDYDVLAITSCPTGIAHTYMAAEAIEKMGKELNIKIKVETQGQSGVKNELTKEEIKKAKGIIIAADTNVGLSRFDGKKLIRTRVSDGISKPKELINKILKGDAPVYKYDGDDKHNNQDNEYKESGWHVIYKHLMSGVTHMLPFVVGGGILIAIAFLLDDYSINPANFGMNTPVAAFFKTVGGVAFNLMLAVFAGYIAMSIADRPGLAVGFVGGMFAIKGTTFESLTNSNAVLISSGFLGAIIAGFVAGYLVLALGKIFKFLPKELEGMKTILIYPVAGILVIGAFMLFINPYVGQINNGMNNFLTTMSGTNKVLLGIILGGMMSVDLGGPVNKAAYTFGTGMLAEGHYDIMAAVMVGGMVPPLAIALLATFFPKKIAKKERQSALLNYVMGLAFISEGAIPFAAADPIRVLVSCILGSAVAGGLSMAFKCTLMAPHGGIFVLPVIGNPLLYLLALIIGSWVAMMSMAILKKNIIE